MARTWILRTDTKGTGAQMVPLETATQRSVEPEPVFVPEKRKPRPEAEPKARAPRKFRVVDVMTRQVLVDGAGTRETVDALKDVRSMIDVSMYVWHEEQNRWRLLTLADQRAMWELARRATESTAVGR